MRQRLYDGEILAQPATDSSQALVERLEAQIKTCFGPHPREAGPDFFARLTQVRAQLNQDWLRQLCRQIVEEAGFPPEQMALDQLRLRGVAPGSDQLPAAQAAFYAHRDTWYANPQSQINLWIPLHEVSASNSFAFYPAYFSQPIENDSQDFEYQAFAGKGGFQSPGAATLAHFPRALRAISEPGQAVELQAGERLWFSAAQLHQTLPNRSQQVRFSVDLRLVHRGDEARGLGAPNVDNRSRGSVLEDYNW